MDAIIYVAIAVVVFLALAFHRVPIAFALAIVGFAGLALLRGLNSSLVILGGTPYAWGTVAALLPMPLFLLMGQFTFYSGISGDLFDTAYKWVGRFPGGIALATNLASTGFGACCGSPVAAIATMGAIAYPEMEKRNYDRRLATGCIVAGGPLSVLIPPSGGFIIFGYLTDTNVGALFIAGILPGLLISAMNLIAIFVMCVRNHQLGPRGPSFPWKEMLISLRGVIAMLLLFILVIGGLMAGVFTPTEAGACGAFGAFIIALAYRRLTFSKVVTASRESLLTTCFVLTMLIGANIFNSFLGALGATTMFSDWVSSLTFAPYAILAIIYFIYIPLGMFMDLGAVLLITVPIIVPALAGIGFDPILQGVLIMILGAVGSMTPPVGIGCFVANQITKVPLGEIFRGVTVFEVILLIGAVIVAAFPQIATFLPNIMTY